MIKVVLSLLLVLLLTSSLACGAVIRVPDDHVTIQQAIANASAGDEILVTGGPYVEQITVNEQITLTGVGMPVIDGDRRVGMDIVTLNAENILFRGFTLINGGTSTYGVEITARSVTVENCSINNARGNGIHLDGVSNVVIRNNTVFENNAYGLDMERSSHNLVLNNNFNASNWHGMVISDNSRFNNISGNVVLGHDYGHGIYIVDSPDNIISGNSLYNNSLQSLSYAGLNVDNASNLTIFDNLVYGNNRNGVYLYDCDNSNFSNNTIRNNLMPSGVDDSSGVYVHHSSSNNFTGNSIYNNENRGIYFENSRYNVLRNNNLSFNPYNFGIDASGISSYFSHDIDTSNRVDSKPIVYVMNRQDLSIDSSAGVVYCIGCDNVSMDGLNLSNNSYGLVLYDCVNSTVVNSSFYSNEAGIFLISSQNNTIYHNNISNNSYGLVLESCSGNNIYFNDLLNNTQAPQDCDSSSTVWNSPVSLLYYFGGNPYNGYMGNYRDSYTGNDSNGDGVGDSIYVISGDTSNDDNPLMYPVSYYSFSANQPPSARFTYVPLLPDTDDVINFTDLSLDVDGSISSWSWDFGDGNSSADKNPFHRYLLAGFFNVILEVTDNRAETANVSETIFVHSTGPMDLYVPENFTTITAALNVSRAGDSILVGPGTYDESVILERSLSLISRGAARVNSTGGPAVTINASGCMVNGLLITNASMDDPGLLINTDNNSILNNVIIENGQGIRLSGANDNTLFNNTCSNNTASGIYLHFSVNNTLFNNTCNDNAPSIPTEGGPQSGIYLDSSWNNVLYYNDLDNPSSLTPGIYNNAYDNNASNRWYNASLSRGNRYSDYTGNDSSGDGVGDTPYSITTQVTDPYPLMPYTPMPLYAPIISGIQTSNLTYDSIDIGWDVSNRISSDNVVRYSDNASMFGHVLSSWDNSTTSPLISFSGLAYNTTYYYSCYSYNTRNSSFSDNSSISSFTTSARPNLILTVDDDDLDIPSPPADYSSLNEAISASIEGDTILVYSGTYTGNYHLDHSLNITGIGDPELIGDQDEPLDEYGDIMVLEADNCIIAGLHFTDANWENSTISTIRDTACIRVGNIRSSFSSWSYAGSDHNIIRNNILEEGRVGIYLNSGSLYNSIEDNTINGTYDGVLFDYARNNIFDSNQLTNIGHYPIQMTRPSYITTYYPITNNTITNNNISDAIAGWGIQIDSVSGNTISGNTLEQENLIWVRGDNNLITDNQITGPHDYHLAGIHLNDGDENQVHNNSVSLHKYGILLSASVSDVNMTGNTMRNNTYNFGFTGDWYYAGRTAQTHTIDSSNTVDGGAPVYYIVGEQDTVYSYSINPAPGYLACVNCMNISIQDLYLEGNAQGIFLYNTTNSSIEGVTTHSNAQSGILLERVEDLHIVNTTISSNGDSDDFCGMFLESSSGCIIEDSIITGNNDMGIKFWYDCEDNIIRNCNITNNGDPTDPGDGTGIYVSGSSAENLTVHSCFIANDHASMQGMGVTNYADNSSFYNNYFNNTQRDAFSASTGTVWNTTPRAGTNILGDPWIAGNYWASYTGADLDGDGLGDTLVPFTSGGKIYDQGDYHPLLNTFIPDTTAPDIQVIAPEENGTYIPQLVYLKVISTSTDVSSWWYSLNGSSNVTFVPNTTITNLTTGPNSLVVYVNDTSGNENSSMVNFTIEEDTTAPDISIFSPVNGTEYDYRDIALNVSSNATDIFSWYYCLDGGSNTTFIPDTTLLNIQNGNHLLIVYAEDVVGNVNSGNVTFTVNVSSSSNPPASSSSNSNVAVVINQPEPEEEEEEGEVLHITSPVGARTISRDIDLKFTTMVPLSRMYYSVDGNEQTRIYSTSATISRLDLGDHLISVKGVDYYGNTFTDNVIIKIIPLSFGEVPTAGTPDYCDEVSYSFAGENTNYTLSFEARNLEEGEVEVYLNRYLQDGGITAHLQQGGLLFGPGFSAGWTAHSLTIPASSVVEGDENLISFIHTSNPKSVTIDDWQLRNVVLRPENPGYDSPYIQVMPYDRVFSTGDELMVLAGLDGISDPSVYEAVIYLSDPEGELICWPDGSASITPLDPVYLELNYDGRLPGALEFNADYTEGVYRLIGIIRSLEDGSVVSVSSTTLYYSDQPSLELFLDSSIYSLEDILHVDLAAVAGEDTAVKVEIYRPDGSVLPLTDDRIPVLENTYRRVFETNVTGQWPDGVYTVKGTLFNEQGVMLDTRAVSFEVCKADAPVTIKLKGVRDVSSSNIRFIDISGTQASVITTEAHDVVETTLPPGAYWMAGEVYTDAGVLYTLPFNSRVVVPCSGDRFVTLWQPFSMFFEEVES